MRLVLLEELPSEVVVDGPAVVVVVVTLRLHRARKTTDAPMHVDSPAMSERTSGAQSMPRAPPASAAATTAASAAMALTATTSSVFGSVEGRVLVVRRKNGFFLLLLFADVRTLAVRIPTLRGQNAKTPRC